MNGVVTTYGLIDILGLIIFVLAAFAFCGIFAFLEILFEKDKRPVPSHFVVSTIFSVLSVAAGFAGYLIGAATIVTAFTAYRDGITELVEVYTKTTDVFLVVLVALAIATNRVLASVFAYRAAAR